MAIRDIGQITDAGYSVNSFSVPTGDPTDVFEFDVVGTRQLSIYLNDISFGDDADIFLYADSNNNGIFDSGDALVASSINAGNSDDVIDYTATTGTYFAQVQRFDPGSSGNVFYDLEIRTNYDVGSLIAVPTTRDNFNLSSSDPIDVFEFDVSSGRQIALNLNNISPGDDADLYLYADSNNNGIFDSDDVLVDSSINGGNSDDVIDYTVTTSGTYFAEVQRFDPGSSSSVTYDLDLSVNYDVGSLIASPISRDNFNLSSSDPTDVFEFDVSSGRQIALNLNNISLGDDADLYLYADSNNNGIFDSNDVLVDSSINGGNSDDVIDYTVTTSGTYFAEVQRFDPGSSGSVTYDLDLSVNYDVGSLIASPISRDNFNLSSSDPTDVFEFDLLTSSVINLSLNDISTGDDADLRLYQDNGNGIFDSDDILVASSLAAGNSNDTINYRGSAGTYFAEVSRFEPGSNGDVAYDLDLSATSGGASNLLAAEVVVGDINSHTPDQFGFVGDTNTSDTYAFSLELFEGVDIQLTGLTNDADIRLIQDFNNNGIVDAGEVIDQSIAAGSSSEHINVDLSGNYLLQVYQFSGDTNYTLEFNQYDTSFA